MATALTSSSTLGTKTVGTNISFDEFLVLAHDRSTANRSTHADQFPRETRIPS